MPQSRLTHRRWFQFGLGTLFFVVTALAVWLGWELRLVRARSTYRQWLQDNGGGSNTAGWVAEHDPTESTERSRIPLWRQWMGDEPIYDVLIPFGSSEDELAHARRLFPEAEYVRIMGIPPGMPFAP